MEIDFNDTDVFLIDVQRKLFEKSEIIWVGYSIENGLFKGSGSALTLNLIISIFKELIVNKVIYDSEILSKL